MEFRAVDNYCASKGLPSSRNDRNEDFSIHSSRESLISRRGPEVENSSRALRKSLDLRFFSLREQLRSGGNRPGKSIPSDWATMQGDCVTLWRRVNAKFLRMMSGNIPFRYATTSPLIPFLSIAWIPTGIRLEKRPTMELTYFWVTCPLGSSGPMTISFDYKRNPGLDRGIMGKAVIFTLLSLVTINLLTVTP